MPANHMAIPPKEDHLEGNELAGCQRFGDFSGALSLAHRGDREPALLVPAGSELPGVGSDVQVESWEVRVFGTDGAVWFS